MLSVILLPGLACDAALWRHQLPLLSQDYRVTVSDAHTRCDSVPEMATAVLAECDGPLVLVGTSMGGMLALQAALQAPDRVHGLALLCTTARADTPQRQRLRRDACVLFEHGRMEEVLRANAMIVFRHRPPGDGALVAEYLAQLRRAGAQQLVRQNRAVIDRADLRPRLHEIACPTLVIGGAQDTLTPPDCAREIAAAVAGAQLEILPGCGHLPTLEQPERVSRLLLDWLASIAPPVR